MLFIEPLPFSTPKTQFSPCKQRDKRITFILKVAASWGCYSLCSCSLWHDHFASCKYLSTFSYISIHICKEMLLMFWILIIECQYAQVKLGILALRGKFIMDVGKYKPSLNYNPSINRFYNFFLDTLSFPFLKI